MASEKMNQNVLNVPKLEAAVQIDAQWDKAPWRGIEANILAFHMGDAPAHSPKVQFKVAYDEEAIYVIYQVHDKYVIAVADGYQGAVYKDSCVEFFFTPGEDVSLGYLNLEMNCGGTALFNFQTKPWINRREIDKVDFNQITVAHSLPEIVNPEIKDSLTWTVEYRIPFSIIEKNAPTVRPQPGVKWRANFYKCADNSSHPHWLTWSHVDFSRPNFHLPEFFGILQFGEATSVSKKADASVSPMSIKAFPDPFNHRTTLRYSVDKPRKIRMDVTNIQGMRVKTLFDKQHDAGQYSANFDASSLPSGVYICSLTDGRSIVSRKVTLAK